MKNKETYQYNYETETAQERINDEKFLEEFHNSVSQLPVKSKESNDIYAAKMLYLEEIHSEIRKTHKSFKPPYIHEEKESFPHGKYCDTVYSVVSQRKEREI